MEGRILFGFEWPFVWGGPRGQMETIVAIAVIGLGDLVSRFHILFINSVSGIHSRGRCGIEDDWKAHLWV